MWSPEPPNMRPSVEVQDTAAYDAARATISNRLMKFPHLEPDRFWFVVRAAGYETELLSWVESMKEEPSPISWAEASAKLQYAKFFERDHPFIEAAREAIGMSVAELDAMWQYAAS